jgi:fumarate hydratase subunit beta
VLTARDAAHKELIEYLEKGRELPVKIKNKMLFYVGPCPAQKDEIIGPIGPTTSLRMDKYTPALLDMGLVATIGKGERSQEVINSIKKNRAVYFTATGGTAVLLSRCVKKADVAAFPGLGPEAVYEFELENFPVIVSIDSEGNTLKVN